MHGLQTATHSANRQHHRANQRLLFVTLLDAQVNAKFEQTFPEAELRSLDEIYSAQFDLGRLRAQSDVHDKPLGEESK